MTSTHSLHALISRRRLPENFLDTHVLRRGSTYRRLPDTSKLHGWTDVERILRRISTRNKRSTGLISSAGIRPDD